MEAPVRTIIQPPDATVPGMVAVRYARQFVACFLAVLVPLAAVAAAAHAQAPWPSRPIRIIVGNPAGSGTDMLARFVGAKLTESVGQQAVVDNRPGANGIIATEFAARSAPD